MSSCISDLSKEDEAIFQHLQDALNRTGHICSEPDQQLLQALEDMIPVVITSIFDPLLALVEKHPDLSIMRTLLKDTKLAWNTIPLGTIPEDVEGLCIRSTILDSIYFWTLQARSMVDDSDRQLPGLQTCPCICLKLAIIYSRIALARDKNPDGRGHFDLACLLKKQSERHGNEEVIEEVVVMFREAYKLSPTREMLHPLVDSLLARFSASGAISDIDEAIDLMRQSEERKVSEDGQIILCDAYRTRFSVCQNPDDLTATLSIIEKALPDGGQARTPEQYWGRLMSISRTIPAGTMNTEQGTLMLEIYRKLLKLLHSVSEPGLDLELSLPRLLSFEGLPSEAAAHALSLSLPEKAVEMLEMGRNLFWYQTRQLQTTINARRSADVYKLRKMQDKFRHLLKKARRIKGYENLMKEPDYTFSSLAAAAEKGPVVVLVGADVSCHAVIIRSPSSSAEHIKLSGVSLKQIRNMTQKLKKIATRSRECIREGSEFIDDISRAGKQSMPATEDLLRTLWVKVVKPVIDVLGYEKAAGRDRPRIWWYPTGAFTFIPLHAAGDYTANGSCCSDYVVSSYTQTLGTLCNAREGLDSVVLSGPKALLVAEPDAPKLERLPNVIREVKTLASIIPPNAVIHLGDEQVNDWLPEHGTSVQAVVTHLPEASILHLACHGIQHDSQSGHHRYATDALRSGFCLRDGDLTVFQLLRLDLPRAFFAFLSACDSAKGDASQSDQSVHLAAAMTFCGFRSVVGTMWSMGDQDGPEVAAGIYKELFKGETMDPDDVPYALDEAVQKLRARKIMTHLETVNFHIKVCEL
ncbi:hypothetical protein EW026_g1753 [Hermanssonia centrifuga]|uniref:CHAT domain-containing protein n=1 Tax=Hermanssonia centrifuga TaxID=98765 RepID=A0A4V3XB64_9APHY|nr:hypothetical protein EW026_g1753 [Hermanssonia centrifuga]